MALFAELRRRNVLKVALLYVVASWLILWFVENTSDALGLPVWAGTFVLLLLAIGFPVALIFAWVYEITPAGLRKAIDVDQTQSIVYKTGQKLNAAVAVLLVLGVLALIGEGLMPKFEFLVPGVPEGDAPVSPRVPAEIRSLTLDNGLEIIVWPDHDIPNVVMYNFVRAGSRNERPGATGIAHFFEHMMFNGTEDRPAGEFDRIMEAAGGANNAYTSNDVTVYKNWFPRAALETVIGLEADRLENLVFDPGVVESERGVVTSERRSSVDNNNLRRLLEQMYATAFIAHPYQFPTIGWASDIAAWTLEDLESFYDTYYAPNNCTMIFTGDITPAEVFGLADEYLAPIPAEDPPPPVRTVEPEQQGTRRLSLEIPAQTPLLHMAFHAGSARDTQRAAMRLLLSILVDGDSSRLHRSLVEESGLAIAVGGWLDEGFDPGLVYFYLALPRGGDPGVVEERLVAELERAASEGVTEAELAKARNIMLADFWRGLATIDGKAATLGEFEVFHGSYELLFDQPALLEKITVADLEAAAASVFRRPNMTVGVVEAAEAPEPGP
jgi:zinc protease